MQIQTFYRGNFHPCTYMSHLNLSYLRCTTIHNEISPLKSQASRLIDSIFHYKKTSILMLAMMVR